MAKFLRLFDGHGAQRSMLATCASLGETSLLEPRHDHSLPPTEPARPIHHRALDSAGHRGRLRQRGIEPVCPRRKNHTRAKQQDGRGLRRLARLSQLVADCVQPPDHNVLKRWLSEKKESTQSVEGARWSAFSDAN
jgi:hypothetical protein